MNNTISIMIIVCSFLTLFESIQLNAQELKLKGFKPLEENTTARIHRKRDVNGQNCAVLIIKHNFKNFKVETGKGYEELIEKIGETWVWLSPDEYRIVIRKEGYVPLSFDLKDKLKQLETYELILTDDFGIIEAEAVNATIWLDNKQVGESQCVLNLKKGEYILKATKKNYYDEERFVILNAGDSLKYVFELKPKMGNLTITSFPNETESADIYINNELNKQKTHATIPLKVGDYSIRIEKKGYLSFIEKVKINENENIQLKAKMVSDPSILVLKYKRRKNIWLASGITASGIGFFAVIQSNQLYQEYQTAGSNASDLRKKIETYDIIYPIAFGIAGFCGVEFVIQSKKHTKAKKLLTFYPQPNQAGGSLCFSYKF